MSIEAIKAIQMVYANTTKHDWPDDIWDAICQAIEAEKQKPVAVIRQYANRSRSISWSDRDISDFPDGTLLYTHPQPKQEQGEPVAFKDSNGNIRMTVDASAPVVIDYNQKQAQQRPFTKQQRDSICMIYDIATGSTTINSLPHIAKISNQLLTEDVYAQPKQEQGEPVAWFREEDEEKIYYATKVWDDCLPLYTHPQPKREPLTVEQLREHWQVAKVLDMTNAEIDFADYVLIARDVEALYGIKEGA